MNASNPAEIRRMVAIVEIILSDGAEGAGGAILEGR
jgi:hypothetical protein